MTLEDRIKSLDNRDRALLMDCITMLHSCELIEDARTRIGISDEYRLQSLHEAINTFYENIGKGYPSVGFKPNTHINWQPFDPDNPPTDTGSEYLLEVFNTDTSCLYHIAYDIDYEDKEMKSDYRGLTLISFNDIKAYAIINPSNL